MTERRESKCIGNRWKGGIVEEVKGSGGWGAEDKCCPQDHRKFHLMEEEKDECWYRMGGWGDWLYSLTRYKGICQQMLYKERKVTLLPD